MENQIALFIALFFLLFSFIGVLRKGLTCIAITFVVYSLFGTFIPSFDNSLVVMIISFGVAIVLSFLLIKFRIVYGFIFGFVVTYLTFFHIVSACDAVMSIINSESTGLLSNLLNDQLFMNHNMIQLIASASMGLIVLIFNKRGMESLSSLLGTFLIVIFLIDIFRGSVSPSMEFKSIFTDFFNVVDTVVSKNREVYSMTLTSNNYLHIFISLPIAFISCIITSIIKKDKYDYL